MTFSILHDFYLARSPLPWVTVFLLVLVPVIQMNEYLCVCLCLQVFSYLVACDHLCRLGYHMAQVEEALEMFQNCETKVRAPFLLFKRTKSYHIQFLKEEKTLFFCLFESSEWILSMSLYLQIRIHPYTYTV